MLTDADLAACRATQQAAMPETVAVLRSTSVADGFGGSADTWATSATVPGRLGAVSRRDEKIHADRLEGRVGWTVTVPSGTDIGAADRLSIGDRSFEVLAASEGTWSTALRVVTVEVTS